MSRGYAGHPPHAAPDRPKPRWRTWLVRLLTGVFFAAIALLLARQARTLDWSTVGGTLRGYRAGTLALATALVACSYAAYAGYEMAARRYSGHGLSDRLTAFIGAIAYAFNMNLGAWLGGIGFRLRLYSQLGVAPAVTARVYLSVLITNWSGYLALGGILFTFWGLDLPPEWKLSDDGLRVLGVLMALAAAAFLVLCARARRRHWTLRGHEIDLPAGRLAAVQMALGGANWLLMGGVVYMLLPHVPAAPAYVTVLATLLVASIAGVATHIPAGLGVLEAVFLALLGHRVPHAQLLGAVLAYRALYFLVPLAVAAAAYAVLESRLRRRSARA